MATKERVRAVRVCRPITENKSIEEGGGTIMHAPDTILHPPPEWAVTYAKERTVIGGVRMCEFCPVPDAVDEEVDASDDV